MVLQRKLAEAHTKLDKRSRLTHTSKQEDEVARAALSLLREQSRASTDQLESLRAMLAESEKERAFAGRGGALRLSQRKLRATGRVPTRKFG